MTEHRDRAREHLALATDHRSLLEHLRRQPVPDHKAIDRVAAEKRDEMKLALIEAVLDVGDAFRDWTRLADEPIAPPADLVLLERAEDDALAACTDERGCEAQLHARSCPEADPHAWPKGVQG